MSGFSVHRSLCRRSHSGDHSDGLTERSSSFGWSFSNRLRVVVPRRGFYRINICCRILLLLICPRRAVVSSSWGRSKKSVHKVASSSSFYLFQLPIPNRSDDDDDHDDGGGGVMEYLLGKPGPGGKPTTAPQQCVECEMPFFLAAVGWSVAGSLIDSCQPGCILGIVCGGKGKQARNKFLR